MTQIWPYLNSGRTISGTGMLEWSYPNPAEVYGTINPGTDTATGVLTFDSVGFQSNASLAIQLNGTTAGSGHDQLKVLGTVALAGSLNVTLGTGYTPAIGDTFTILDNDDVDPISGSFNGLAEGGLLAVGNDFFQITYAGGDGNDVVLEKVSAGAWDGGGADSNWLTPANWVGDVVPLPGAHLIFPSGAQRLSNVNDFAADTAFGSILITGSNYNLSGNPLVLNGSVTSSGSGNTFGVGVQLGASGGFANTVGSQFTVTSAVDTNGHTLNLNTSSGTMLVSGTISGAGGVSTGGSGTTALAGANSYAGATTVTGGTLAVRHDAALGSGDNLAATGTSVTSINAVVRLENGVTIANERLSSPAGIYFNLQSVGNGITNVWDGDIAGGTYFYLRPGFGNTLQVEREVSTNSVVYVSDYGRVVFNGTSPSLNYLFVGNGGAPIAEVNGTLTSVTRPFVNSSYTLSGEGTLQWNTTSS
jgi:autotransporter-associated beta strand protein